MEIITSMQVLFQKVKTLGNARKNNESPEKIKELEEDLKEYEQICLKSDQILMNTNISTNQVLK